MMKLHKGLPTSYKVLLSAFIVVSAIVLVVPWFFPAAVDAILSWAVVALAFATVLAILHSSEQNKRLREELHHARDEEREHDHRQASLDEIRNWAEMAWGFVSQPNLLEGKSDFVKLWRHTEPVTVRLFDVNKLAGAFDDDFKTLLDTVANDFWTYLNSFVIKGEKVTSEERDHIIKARETARRSLMALFTSITKLKLRLWL